MKIKQLSKYTAIFLAGVIFATAGSVYAEDGIKSIKALLRNDVKIVSNGEEIKLNNPVINYEGKTYLYLRDLQEIFDSRVSWNGNLKQIEISSNNKPSDVKDPHKVDNTQTSSSNLIDPDSDPDWVPPPPSKIILSGESIE